MFRRPLIAAVLATGLTGCITVYEYGAQTESDDYYYSEPSIDHYDTGYGYGPYYGGYSYSPYYDPFGYRYRSGWFGNFGFQFGHGFYGGLSYYPYWYYGYGYGHGYGWSHYDPFWPHRYYGHRDHPRHRPPADRPPHERPPGERRPPRAIEREDVTGRRLQGIGRPVPEIISTPTSAPRVLNGSMPRVRPSQPAPEHSPPRVVMAPAMPTQREPRTEQRNDAPPRQMPAHRFERDQDAPTFRPAPTPRPRPNASERDAGHEPK
jgi:hypothetical protein